MRIGKSTSWRTFPEAGAGEVKSLRGGKKRCLIVVMSAAIIIGAAGGIAYATIPDSGGVIHTCLSKALGTWRPIDFPSQQCKSGEMQLDLYSKAGAEAAFLTKNAKAADSDLLDGKDSTEFLGATAKAADADKLDGLDSTAFLGATAKASDADKLDGRDSSEFARSRDLFPGGVTFPHASQTSRSFMGASVPWTVTASCFNSAGTTRFEVGAATAGQFLFAVTRPGGTSSAVLASGSASDLAADRNGAFVIQMAGAGNEMITLVGSVLFGTGTCIVSLQAVITG